MHLLPYQQETIILPFTAQEALQRLRLLTRPVEQGIAYSSEEEAGFLFHGLVKKERFRISRRVTKPENFLPLMVGRVESTSVGCLVFVRYRLFFATAMYLVFWSLVCLLLGLFFLIYQEAWWYAAIALAIGLVQLVVALKNFSWQVKRSRQELDKAFFSTAAPPGRG